MEVIKIREGNQRDIWERRTEVDRAWDNKKEGTKEGLERKIDRKKER